MDSFNAVMAEVKTWIREHRTGTIIISFTSTGIKNVSREDSVKPQDLQG